MSWSPWLSAIALAIVLNTALLAIAWIAPKKLLTPAGYGHAWLLGVLVWFCLGLPGYGVVMVYFLLGSAVTRLGFAKKEAAGIAEGRSGLRGPENVWGSATGGVLCAMLFFALSFATLEPVRSWLLWGYVASFSTKLADTTASEVGKAYGRRTFLITTLQPVPPGTEGAISLEGTLAGIAASLVIALVGWGLAMVPGGAILPIMGAAFLATNLESLIGATLQTRWQWLTNEIVNGINTLLGAAIAIGFAWSLTTLS